MSSSKNPAWRRRAPPAGPSSSPHHDSWIAAAVALSILLLGSCLGQAASAWVLAGQAPIHLSLDVITDKAALPSPSKATEVRIASLTYAGRPLAATDLSLRGSWRVEANANSGPHFIHKAPDKPTDNVGIDIPHAPVEMRVLRHAFSGAIRVRDSLGHDRTIDLYAKNAVYEGLVLGAPDSWPARIGAYILLCLLAFAIAPWKGGFRATTWLVLSVACMHALYFLAAPVGCTTDSPGYLWATRHFWAGRPDQFPVGYGLFCNLIGLGVESGSRQLGTAVVLVQHALTVAGILALFVAMRTVVRERWAFLGALMAGLSPASLFLAQMAMSESLTFPCLVGAWYFAWIASRRRQWAWAVAAGVCGAWATLARIIPVVVVAPVYGLLFLFPWRQRCWRHLWIALGVIALACGSVLANYALRSGRVTFSTITGRHLLNHFVHCQKLLARDGPATRQLLEIVPDPTSLPHWEIQAKIGADREARLGGENFYMRVAMEAAKTASLGEHLTFTTGLAWRNLSKPMRFSTPRQSVPRRFDSFGLGSPPVDARLLRVRGTVERWVEHLDSAWLWMCWVLLALSLPVTLLLRCERRLWLACLSIPFAYVFASSAVEYELPRYQLAIAPFVYVQSIATIGVLWDSLGRLALRLRDRAQAEA